MTIKAIGFDLGHTLIDYPAPINWEGEYESALRETMSVCGIAPDITKLRVGTEILTKYNTRRNPRVQEVTATGIFTEILVAWGETVEKLPAIKQAFFDYFQQDAVPYEDVDWVLKAIRDKNIKIGVLTDVPYGEEDELSLRDLKALQENIDMALTSVAVGFRKPCGEGYLHLAKALGVLPREMLFVGDEEKDIRGAKSVGMRSVLLRRKGVMPPYGQDYSIAAMGQLFDILARIG